jgi:murein DD-endopeptidase MepM/ murein hydrolase activator NlpD
MWAWHSIMIRGKYHLYLRRMSEYRHGATRPLPQVPQVLHQENNPDEELRPTRSRESMVIKRVETRSFNAARADVPFEWPLKRGSFWVSSRFGPRVRHDGSLGFHYGIDLAAPKGTVIVAPRSGIVLYAGYMKKYGNMVIVKHDARFKTRYAHLNAVRVRVGAHLAKGAIIGHVGDTGYIRKEGKDGSHLHFELYDYDKRVNPMKFLPKL